MNNKLLILAFICLAIGAAGILTVTCNANNCTADKEGIIYHHGESGGIDYRCHNGKWVPN
jgi:hypothetical protein